MDLERVLHMKGGSEETSYAQTAYVAKRVIEMTKPIREEAIAKLFRGDVVKSRLCIADLGCASGPNTLTVVSELMIASEKIRRRSDGKAEGELEYQVNLNDLPGNDFNSVFMSMPSFYQKLKEEYGIKCFVVGVPGSFYDRLFPCQTLHFVHASYSLYWLSKVPEGLDANNNNNIYISRTSPPSVIKGYQQQFQNDTALFLASRSRELLKGGQMVLTYWGRPSQDPASNHFWDPINTVLSQLVSEGIIEGEKLQGFNVPVYHPSSTEVLEEVKKEGSFCINSVDVSQVNFDAQQHGYEVGNKGEMPSKLTRAVVESLLATHFGTAVVDHLFQRLIGVLEDTLTKHTILCTNVTISLTKN